MSPDRRLEPRGIGLANVAWALSQQAELRELANLFAESGVKALHLPWPRFGALPGTGLFDQQPPSIDVLVQRAHTRVAARTVERSGWAPVARRGLRRYRTGSLQYSKHPAILDLYGSIRVTQPVPRRLRDLEWELWDGAAEGTSGLLEPRPEPLFVFRAMQALAADAGMWHEPSRRPSLHPRDERIDQDEVRRIAERSQLEGVLLAPAQPRYSMHLVPGSVRGPIREALTMQRAGYGLVPRSRRATRVRVDDLDLRVASGVFEPRRRIANTMIATCVSLSKDLTRPLVIDVGTGCGATALAYASRRPDARVVGLDISYRAVSCARRNRDRLGPSSVCIARSDLLNELPDRALGAVDLLVANIPYVPPATASRTDWGAPVETARGIDPDGLGLILQLVRQASRFLRVGGVVVLQLTGWQWQTLEAELKAIGYEPMEPQTWGDDRAAVASAIWRGAAGRVSQARA